MATAWITGVCVLPNRLEWTVLRRVKDAWEPAGQGGADLPGAEGGKPGLAAAALKPHLRHFKGRVAVALPTDRTLLRVALLPSTDAAELRGMAELQTDKFSPFPVENVAAGAEVLEAAGSSSLVAMAVVIYLGGAFSESQRVWSWLALLAVLLAGWAWASAA